MSARLVTECGLCGHWDLKPVLHLGSSPATCDMRPVGARWESEEHYPLTLLHCEQCTLVQLSVVVDPTEVFAPDYPYSSGNSPALHENFGDLAAEASTYMSMDDLVVDIGANDGTLLSKFEGYRRVGVEPTDQAKTIKADAYYQEFFGAITARKIVAVHGRAKVVTACNVLAHVEDIGDVMRGIDILLADDGVLIAENHDLASVVGGQWDTVYHEHLRFYSPYSFSRLLQAHGMGTAFWERIPTHGGSFRMMAQKGLQDRSALAETYDFDELANKAWQARRDLRDELLNRDIVFGIGATARATTTINYCGLDVEDIAYVCEVTGSDKIGHYVPGTRIPVIDEVELLHYPDWAAVLFSWHMADIIVPKLRERGYCGEIIVPLPALTTA